METLVAAALDDSRLQKKQRRATAARKERTHPHRVRAGLGPLSGLVRRTRGRRAAGIRSLVARYLGTLGERLKIASIRRRVVAISQQHKERGFASPTVRTLVREVVTGIARTHGSAQTRKTAITTDVLGTLLKALDRETLRGQRDRAILLLGFSGAFRRSELAALDVGDLAFDDRGLVVTVRSSKTDQKGKGRQVAVPFVRSNAERCPVTATREWLRVAEITDGPVFRTFALPAAQNSYGGPVRGADTASRAVTNARTADARSAPNSGCHHAAAGE